MSCVIHKFRMVHLLATPVQSASAFWWWCWVPVSMRHLKRSETPNRWRSGPVYENKPFREHYPERTGDGRGPRGGRSGLYTFEFDSSILQWSDRSKRVKSPNSTVARLFFNMGHFCHPLHFPMETWLPTTTAGNDDDEQQTAREVLKSPQTQFSKPAIMLKCRLAPTANETIPGSKAYWCTSILPEWRPGRRRCSDPGGVKQQKEKKADPGIEFRASAKDLLFRSTLAALSSATSVRKRGHKTLRGSYAVKCVVVFFCSVGEGETVSTNAW